MMRCRAGLTTEYIRISSPCGLQLVRRLYVMIVRMDGLMKRGGVWIYRRMVPAKLRPMIGAREIKRSLGTGDLKQAQRRWIGVKEEVDRLFAQAATAGPGVLAYKAVQGWREGDERQEEGLDLHLTTLLETKSTSVPLEVVEALLKRKDRGGADNP